MWIRRDSPKQPSNLDRRPCQCAGPTETCLFIAVASFIIPGLAGHMLVLVLPSAWLAHLDQGLILATLSMPAVGLCIASRILHCARADSLLDAAAYVTLCAGTASLAAASLLVLNHNTQYATLTYVMALIAGWTSVWALHVRLVLNSRLPR